MLHIKIKYFNIRKHIIGTLSFHMWLVHGIITLTVKYIILYDIHKHDDDSAKIKILCELL